MVTVRKIKDKVKKALKKPKAAKVKISIRKPAHKITPKQPVADFKKEVIGSAETSVEQAKFFTPVSTPRSHPRIVSNLPGGYGKDRIVLMVRDPRWVYTYWEVTYGTMDKLKERLGSAFYEAKRILRVYDVSNINFNGANAHRFFDIEVGHEAMNWYIDTAGPGRSWIVDVGLRLASGEFILIARSNVVQTPLDGPSWITDEEWMIPDEMFGRLYGMGFGFGRSSPVGKAWMKEMLSSGVLSSPGMASMASPVKKPKQRKFWLVVNAELIVYGATEPDAKVTLQGRPVKLNPDGTFSARFALPDGKQVIPVEATSADNLETRTITPIVSRETKSSVELRQEAKK